MYLESRINSFNRTNAYVDKILISLGIHSENAFSYSNQALYTSFIQYSVWRQVQSLLQNDACI